MFLAQMAVVFVGVTGNHHEVVVRQLAPTLEKAGVAELAIPGPDLGAILKHSKQSKAIVQKMHVGGVIAAQLVGSGNARTFRVVIYDGNGNLSSETESPISAKGLAKDDLDVFRINVADIAGSTSPKPTTKPQPTTKHNTKQNNKAPHTNTHTNNKTPPKHNKAPTSHPAA